MSNEVIRGLSIFAGVFSSIAIWSVFKIYFGMDDPAQEYWGEILAGAFTLAAYEKLTKKYSATGDS